MREKLEKNFTTLCENAQNPFLYQQVLHIDTTTGTLIDTIDFSNRISKVTSVTFGGRYLDELYVTSTTFGQTVEQQSLEPESGALFKVTNVGAKGVGGGVNYKMNLDNKDNYGLKFKL